MDSIKILEINKNNRFKLADCLCHKSFKDLVRLEKNVNVNKADAPYYMSILAHTLCYTYAVTNVIVFTI